MFLLLVVLLVWESEVRYGGNLAYQASRLSRAGLMITGAVVMFQFYAAQILAVIMLSNSISDEVYHKTLGTLMTTPINSFQIIMGKLLSKLLQIFLLACLTLPILGIIRVFGGVPWDYLLINLCVTLTAVIFAGMLSLNISINHKHAYVVIILTTMMLFLLYVVLPIFGAWISYEYFDISSNAIMRFISFVNPLVTSAEMLDRLYYPGNTGLSLYGWGWHCLCMLAGSALLFLRAIIVVRKKALLQACGQTESSKKKWRLFPGSKKQGKIRRVKGNPVLWKELRRSSFDMSFMKKTIMAVAVIGCVLFSYYMCDRERIMDEEGIHIFYCIVFLIIALFFTTVYSATSITSEKASRSLPVLLTTLVSDRQILTAKTVGVFRRTMPAWTLLFVHIIIFTLIKYIHPAAIFQVAIVVFGAAIFVISSGIFFSSLLKNTTSAVIANLIFIAVVWAGIPFLVGIIDVIAMSGDDFIELVMSVNPFYHIVLIMEEGAGDGAVKNLSQLDYYMFFDSNNDWNFWATTTFQAFTAAGYCAVSLIFFALAKGNLRRKIF